MGTKEEVNNIIQINESTKKSFQNLGNMQKNIRNLTIQMMESTLPNQESIQAMTNDYLTAVNQSIINALEPLTDIQAILENSVIKIIQSSIPNSQDITDLINNNFSEMVKFSSMENVGVDNVFQIDNSFKEMEKEIDSLKGKYTIQKVDEELKNVIELEKKEVAKGNISKANIVFLYILMHLIVFIIKYNVDIQNGNMKMEDVLPKVIESMLEETLMSPLWIIGETCKED